MKFKMLFFLDLLLSLLIKNSMDSNNVKEKKDYNWPIGTEGHLMDGEEKG